jgi:tetratricopeptide (TPR) repeat protein
MGRQDEAVETLGKAMALFQGAHAETAGPNYAAALAGMAEAYYRMGKFAEAVAAYESALEHIQAAVGENADYAVTLRNCAVASDALGAPEQAEKMMARAHEILTALGMATHVPEEQAGSRDLPKQ